MDLLSSILKAGVVGAGGAGFPTHIKYAVKTEWLIINAIECEPLIHTDKFIIREKAQEIIDTILIIAKHLSANKIAIGIKEHNSEEIKLLQEAIGNNAIDIVTLNSTYPAGDEQVLIYEVTKERVPIGKLPKDIGVTVSNVCTICDIADSLKGIPKIEKTLSVVGAISEPSMIDVPIGMNVLECLSYFEGLPNEFSVIVGGPMMGRIYSQEECVHLSITKTTNSLIILPKDHYLERNQNKKIQHMINQTHSACIQCRECTDMCPRFLLGHPLHPHRIMRSVAYGKIRENIVFEESLLCCECGVCDYVCPMNLSPRRMNQYVKKELWGKPRESTPKLRNVVENRDYRKLATSRLIYMIDINQYYHQKPTTLRRLEAKEVAVNLKQHIGVASEAIIKINDNVQKGELIAQIPEGALGANIHAPISGKVVEITQQFIVIKSS